MSETSKESTTSPSILSQWPQFTPEEKLRNWNRLQKELALKEGTIDFISYYCKLRKKRKFITKKSWTSLYSQSFQREIDEEFVMIESQKTQCSLPENPALSTSQDRSNQDELGSQRHTVQLDNNFIKLTEISQDSSNKDELKRQKHSAQLDNDLIILTEASQLNKEIYSEDNTKLQAPLKSGGDVVLTQDTVQAAKLKNQIDESTKMAVKPLSIKQVEHCLVHAVSANKKNCPVHGIKVEKTSKSKFRSLTKYLNKKRKKAKSFIIKRFQTKEKSEKEAAGKKKNIWRILFSKNKEMRNAGTIKSQSLTNTRSNTLHTSVMANHIRSGPSLKRPRAIQSLPIYHSIQTTIENKAEANEPELVIIRPLVKRKKPSNLESLEQDVENKDILATTVVQSPSHSSSNNDIQAETDKLAQAELAIIKKTIVETKKLNSLESLEQEVEKKDILTRTEVQYPNHSSSQKDNPADVKNLSQAELVDIDNPIVERKKQSNPEVSEQDVEKEDILTTNDLQSHSSSKNVVEHVFKKQCFSFQNVHSTDADLSKTENQSVKRKPCMYSEHKMQISDTEKSQDFIQKQFYVPQNLQQSAESLMKMQQVSTEKYDVKPDLFRTVIRTMSCASENLADRITSNFQDTTSAGDLKNSSFTQTNLSQQPNRKFRVVTQQDKVHKKPCNWDEIEPLLSECVTKMLILKQRHNIEVDHKKIVEVVYSLLTKVRDNLTKKIKDVTNKAQEDRFGEANMWSEVQPTLAEINAMYVKAEEKALQQALNLIETKTIQESFLSEMITKELRAIALAENRKLNSQQSINTDNYEFVQKKKFLAALQDLEKKHLVERKGKYPSIYSEDRNFYEKWKFLIGHDNESDEIMQL